MATRVNDELVTANDVLDRMYMLVSAGWTPHWSATDAKGNYVHSSNPRAAKWSLLGAKYKALDDLRAGPAIHQQVMNRLADEISDAPVMMVRWNALTTQSKVLAVIKATRGA